MRTDHDRAMLKRLREAETMLGHLIEDMAGTSLHPNRQLAARSNLGTAWSCVHGAWQILDVETRQR